MTYGTSVAAAWASISSARLSPMRRPRRSPSAGSSVINVLNAIQLREIAGLGIANALAGYWNFNETSGATAADASGNGNSGVVQNAYADGGQWTAGKVGGALRFRGAGLGADYVAVANWPGPSGGLVSLSAWVLADTNQSESLIGAVQSSSK